MRSGYAMLIPITVVIVGCASPAPVPVNFALTHQKVARTAHHWDVVADDVVSETLRAITEKPQLQGRGVYISHTKNTAFNVAFREFMITHMVNQGADVSVCKSDMRTGRGGFTPEAPDVEVNYDIQFVKHGGQLPKYQPPRWTVLAAGVAVARDAFLAGDETTATIGGIAFGEWWAGHYANPPQAEIIVTTTIAENNRFVSRKSDIYYVPEADSKLFVQRVAQRTVCPGEKNVAMDDGAAEASREVTRQEIIERGQARTNPQWRNSTSYSY